MLIQPYTSFLNSVTCQMKSSLTNVLEIFNMYFNYILINDFHRKKFFSRCLLSDKKQKIWWKIKIYGWKINKKNIELRQNLKKARSSYFFYKAKNNVKMQYFKQF